MDALLIMIVAFVGYIAMYKLYGQYLGKKIFALSPTAKTPSREFEDGVDYVPTRKEIIFGHHFTSIAGTGPIVGPAIAVIWGWLPAMIWVFVGSVVMGAVHDFGALVISLRNQGRSISDYTAKYINSRTRFMFFLIVFLELWIVIAIFGLVIAVIFAMYPQSVLAVWIEVPIAIALGYLVYKKGGNVTSLSIWAILLMYLFVFLGPYLPIKMPTVAGIPATGVWTIILLTYGFIASVLPVTTLLQPRDFINSHQLVIAMALLVLGVLVASFTGRLEIVAPTVQATPAEAPSMWPFLFITIACGAISGFHSLVSSGTSGKQVRNEEDALFVGYGSMLMEGALATLVIIAVAAGIGMGYTTKAGETLTGVAAWTTHYASWAAAAGLGSKVSAFVDGSANMIMTLGIPKQFTLAIMAVFVASFAGTTLDSATRIQRYVLSELFTTLKLDFLTGKYIATFIAVGSAMILAFATGASGKGALKLWPMFGAVNQTLAALALIVITVYLKTRGGMKWMVAGLPAVFMAVMTLWAAVLNQLSFGRAHNMLLQSINFIIIILAAWIVVEGLIKFFQTDATSSADAQTVTT
ncbi:MAG TPA: carbon starvation protein A [Desulfobacteraceae bacterium]|nr:carbon starvation protein A [Deltaproteobacteria bacterium]MBW2355471.1 carbon starvation protein A [Deltaproteobacteria bacterium]RLB96105.1 MAG: carbon starvation protein A [Deltaproteobacteria bacterium]HDI60446.1 carbon starvation protein A [Desulfobacteraceae bacterium]